MTVKQFEFKGKNGAPNFAQQGVSGFGASHLRPNRAYSCTSDTLRVLAEIASRKEKILLKTLSAIYKGERVVELPEDIDLPKDIAVLVVVPDQEDERELRSQLQSAAEVIFARLWDNEEDEV